MTGFWGFVYMPGGHLFVGQVVILAVACGLYSPSCREEVFSETHLPTVRGAVDPPLRVAP
jgi:hypothetical protein